MKIVVLDGYALNPGDNPWDEVAAAGEFTVYDRTAADETLPRAAGAEVLLTNKTPLARETLAHLPDLKLICVLATGYNVVDVAAARERGVTVCNVPEYATDTVAQYTFALLLELCSRVGRHDRAVHEGAWQRSEDFCFWLAPLEELAGRTMGLVGLGRIGRRTAEIARAFGMHVIAHDPACSAGEDNVAMRSLEALFAEADVVSLHCPQTEATTGLVNATLLGRMKPSALLINTARGALVNEADLAEALRAGRLAGAAVDVAATEPPPADSPLLSAPNCIITPHIAWASVAARRRLMHTTAENIRAFQAGRPGNVVS